MRIRSVVYVAALAVVVGAGGCQGRGQTDAPVVINRNATVDPGRLGPFVSNANTPSGIGLLVIAPNEEAAGQPAVDHARIVQMGFGIDPIYSCYLANGTAARMTTVQNREALCTFQARGCADPNGCTIEGAGFALSPSQFRIMSCQDWTPDGRCARVQMSTTQRGTIVESTKVNWDDGGHIEYGNFPPNVDEGCGDGATVEGTDNAFRIVIGSAPSARCVVRFHNAWTLAYAETPYRPICTASNETRPAAIMTRPSSADLALANIAAGDEISVICVGRHDLP